MAGYAELRAANESTWTAFDATVSISDYEENFNVLDGDNAGRSKLRGRMIRDVLGSFIGHKITFYRSGMSAQAVESFDALWEWLKQHSIDDSIYIRAADGQTTIEYEAYYTSGTRKLESVENGVNYWDEISVNFIPMEPQIYPT